MTTEQRTTRQASEKAEIEQRKQHMPPALYAEFQARQAEVQQHLTFVRSVFDMLGETSPPVFFRLHLVVRALGAPRVITLLKQTIAIEEQGGLMVLNGSRRRTPGGVFFQLAKEQYQDILPARFFRPIVPAKEIDHT
jgi:hypothetical protein